MPKIFVFCNCCEYQWHSMVALGEDGKVLAGHICSDHFWAKHDMGIDENGWKRDIYEKHYPEGFEVEWVEEPLKDSRVLAAIELNKKKPHSSIG